MKKLVTICILALCSITTKSWAQFFTIDPIYYSMFDQDSLQGFDEPAARAAALSEQFYGSEFKVKMYRMKREYINNKYNLYKDVPVQVSTAFSESERPPAVPGCVNEDFEASTAAVVTSSTQINGWVVTAGYNGFVSPTGALSAFFPGGLNGANSCNLFGCCPMPPANSELIDCSAPGGFVDPQIGNQYPIFSVFGSGNPNNTAAVGNPHITQPMFGNKVFRLNDGQTGDYSIEKLSKTFAVTSSNALFQFAFISVFSPGHGCCDAGGLQIKLTNATTNSVLPCPVFSVSAPSSACTATVPVDYFVSGTGAVYTATTSAAQIYNRWKINSLDLSAYIGQNITIDFIVSDCNAGGHYGKVYVDAQCGPMTINGNGINFDAGIANVVVPTCGAAGATICAAAGLGPYYWAGPGITPNQATPSMSNQCLTSTISATYTLYMLPQGACQPITRIVTSTITPAPLLAASVVQATCGSNSAVVTVTPSGSALNPSTLNWSPNPFSINSTTTQAVYQIPTTSPMNVVITASDPLGCLVTASVDVNPAPPFPTFTVVNLTNSYSITCLFPSVNLDAQTTYSYNNGTLNYFWASPNATFATNNVNISIPGAYTVTAVDPVTACQVVNVVNIGVNTVVPNSIVTPNNFAISCASSTVTQVSACASQSVNITQNFFSPLGATLTAPNSCTTYPVGLPGVYTVVTVDDVNGCFSSKNFTVTASQGFPTFNLGSPQNFTLGCSTKSLAIINILNASATNSLQVPNGGAVSYTLIGPPTSTTTPSGTLSPISTYSVNVPGTWTVIVKDNVSLCETKLPFSVLLNNFAPDINAVVPVQVLTCQTPTTTLKGVSLTNNVNYSWAFPTAPGNQQGDTLTVGILLSQPSKTTVAIYTLTVEDASSLCRNTYTVKIDQNVYPPKASITNGGVAGISCKTPTVTLTNLSTTGIPANTFPAPLPVVAAIWEGPTPQEPATFTTTYVGFTTGVYSVTAKDLNNGCVSVATISIQDFRDYPKVTVNEVFTFDCGATGAELKPTVNDNAKLTYLWTAPSEVSVSPSFTSQNIIANGIGEFNLLVVNEGNGCLVNIPTTVINGSLTVDFEPDFTSGFAPLKVNLKNTSRSSLDVGAGPFNVRSVWDFGTGTTLTQSTTIGTFNEFKLPGTYTITLYGAKGSCLERRQKVITVELPSKLEVPNVFTPNGDKINDIFFLETNNLSEISMVIVDRWGHVVYELNNSTTGNVEWNGKNQAGVEVADGVYFYTLKAKGTDGAAYDKTGTITLTR